MHIDLQSLKLEQVFEIFNIPDREFDHKMSLKVTDEHISGKVTYDFLYVINSNQIPDYCHLTRYKIILRYYKCPIF